MFYVLHLKIVIFTAIKIRHWVKRGMDWNGMDWNGMEWNGMEWIGMEWNEMEWNGLEFYSIMSS